MVTIVDYKAGNIASIQNMLKKIGVPSIISDKPDEVLRAEKIILPGVGAFDHGIQQLNQSGLRESLEKSVLEGGVPFLGICLGLQLLCQESEEGVEPGLGWIQAKTKRFNFQENNGGLKIPHMGWADVEFSSDAVLFSGMPEESRFYFVHSFHLVLENPENEMVAAQYGYRFTAGICCKNIYGVQFHPEKSHKYGMQLLRNFSKL